MLLKNASDRGALVAQSVKCQSLDFGSGHDLTVRETELCLGFCADGPEPVWDSLSLSFSAPPLLTLCLPLSQNKHFFKPKKKWA